jgi:hypothetical protein
VTSLAFARLSSTRAESEPHVAQYRTSRYLEYINLPTERAQHVVEYRCLPRPPETPKGGLPLQRQDHNVHTSLAACCTRGVKAQKGKPVGAKVLEKVTGMEGFLSWQSYRNTSRVEIPSAWRLLEFQLAILPSSAAQNGNPFRIRPLGSGRVSARPPRSVQIRGSTC